jgi:outer membrane protein assembly factor BamD
MHRVETVLPQASSLLTRTLGGSIARACALALLIAPVAGCSTLDSLNPFGGEKYETKLLADEPAEQIYDQGLARLQRSDYEGASKKFAELEKQFPFSQWSRKGLLMVTYSNFEGAKYDDAVVAGNRYVSLYPSTPETPYALYLIGMSMYNQIPDISRDQDRAEQAVKVFNDLVQKFPKSEYAEEAKFKRIVARDQLAGKEMSVGRFYLSRKNDTAAAVLGHNYPDSQWYKDAYSRLASGGLAPNENRSSWMSRLFRTTT